MNKVNNNPLIATILFDLSDVLLQGIAGSAKYVKEKIRMPVSDTYFYIEEFNQLMLGQITEDAYWKSIISKNSWSVTVEDLKKAARKNFIEIKGTREIMEKLKKKGFRLALLSNNAREWIEYCEITYQYRQLFQEVIYSFEAKLSKPNKDLFMLMLQKLEAKPQECLFIDDYSKNLIAAEELGFKTIQFISAADLKKKLKRFEIIV